MDTALAAWLLVAFTSVAMIALAILDRRKDDSSRDDR